MKEKDKLLTVQEVCQTLKISRITLYRMLKSGRLPGFKVGHQWRFRVGEVESYFMNLARYAPQLYSLEVMERYRTQPEKYLLTETERGGEIRLKTESLQVVSKVSWFEYFRYSYRLWRGQKVVRLAPHELKILPYEEYTHWYKYRIKFEYTQ